MSFYFLNSFSMARRCHPRELSPPEPQSPESIQGLSIQGPFDLDDLPLKCFHYEEVHDRYYSIIRGL